MTCGRAVLKSMILLAAMLASALLSAAAPAQAQNRNITVVLPEEPDTLEPCNTIVSVVGKVLKQSVVESLTEIAPPSVDLKPRLATSWEAVDPLTWRFKLRQGVKFHDGADFNAQAVIHAINRTFDPALDCGVRIKYFGGVKVTMKAIDAYTIDISTEKPSPILPTMLAPLSIMSPNTKMGVTATNPIGTGPYQFVNWQSGQQINLKRFDGYWGPKPQVEQAKFVWRTESSVRASMVAIGEADLAPNISLEDATKPDMDISYSTAETLRLRMDVDREPLTDRRVREAMNLAIDRKALIGSVFSKDVQIATQIIGPAVNGYNADIPEWPYDPERAKALLKAARDDGIPVGREITIMVRKGWYPNSSESMEAVAAMLTAVGFNIKILINEVANFRRYTTKPYPDGGPTLHQDAHDNNGGDAVFSVFIKYHSNGGHSKLTDIRLDRIIDRATTAIGYERRRLWQDALYVANRDIIADIPFFHLVGYARVGGRINFTPNVMTNGQIDLEKITFK